MNGCTTQAASDPNDQQVTIAGRTFTLELALDDDARYKGLGGRSEIPDDGGMLFVFPYARYTEFVMRDCLVPIDIIFLGPTGEIIAMHEMHVEPGVSEWDLTRYPSVKRTQFVIELKGGTLDELNLARGQHIELPYDDLKARAR